MITNPDEIYALATALGQSKIRLQELTDDLRAIRAKLGDLWPDFRGEEVREEIRKVEALDEEAANALADQFNSLLKAYEAWYAASQGTLGGGAL